MKKIKAFGYINTKADPIENYDCLINPLKEKGFEVDLKTDENELLILELLQSESENTAMLIIKINGATRKYWADCDKSISAQERFNIVVNRNIDEIVNDVVLPANKKYILPFYYGAPSSPTMMILETETVRNITDEHYGKCSVYMSSHYNPLIDAINQIDSTGYITIEQAEGVLKSFKCIHVKEDFNQYNIDDLKEIKHLLPKKWIKGYNESESMF